MATAARQSAADPLARGARNVGVLEPMEFLIFEDQAGAFRLKIVAGDGGTLAQAEGFAPRDRPKQAAQRIGEGAGSARLEHRAHGVSPLDLTGVRDGSGDELDAEHGLDEGESFSSEVVAR